MAEMGFLHRVAGVSLRDRERSSANPGGTQSRATAPLHGKEPIGGLGI